MIGVILGLIKDFLDITARSRDQRDQHLAVLGYLANFCPGYCSKMCFLYGNVLLLSKGAFAQCKFPGIYTPSKARP